MARFYGSMQGNKGEATRIGTASSGLSGHIRGWSIGGRVVMSTNGNGKDVVTIWLTSGSNRSKHPQLLGHFTYADDGSLVKTV